MSEKRITPDEVAEAYQKTGMSPGTGHMRPYYYGDSCCGLGAIASMNGVSKPYSWADATFGKDYVHGFIQGFDGVPEPRIDTDRQRDGYEDGKAAAERVFAAVE